MAEPQDASENDKQTSGGTDTTHRDHRSRSDRVHGSWRLAQEGIESVLLERASVPGGLIRSEHMNGVLYEPHGSHIFHTEDEEVWRLANSMTPFRPYRHRVDIVVEGKVLNWPILLSDIDAQSRSEEIKTQLQEREAIDPDARAQAANFEEWCLELMGPILYER